MGLPMKALFRWLSSKNRREILSFLGAGIAAIAVGTWTVMTYSQDKKEAPSETISPTISPTIENKPVINVHPAQPPAGQIEVTYQVCFGEYQKRCPPNTTFVYCGKLASWATKECGKYIAITLSGRPGDKCGYGVVQVKCVANE
jgi:hypothetical protein